MSEWYSLGGDEIRGLDYDTEKPTATIGVALSWYDVARVGIRGDEGNLVDTVLLGAEQLRELAARLLRAADKLQGADPALVTHLLADSPAKTHP